MINEEFYESYQKYILQLIDNLPEFVYKLKGENEESFAKDFDDLIEGISWISKYLIASNDKSKVDTLNDMLKKINMALSEKNYYLMGDIIEYDLLSFLKEDLKQN